MPEQQIKGFSGYEVVIGSTNFLTCALANDSGAGHMLSTNYCPLIKLFSYHDIHKFTPATSKITAISAKEFGSANMSDISIDYVIKKIEEAINTSTN